MNEISFVKLYYYTLVCRIDPEKLSIAACVFVLLDICGVALASPGNVEALSACAVHNLIGVALSSHKTPLLACITVVIPLADVCTVPGCIVLNRKHLACRTVLNDVISVPLLLNGPSLVVRALVLILQNICPVVLTVTFYIYCQTTVEVDDLIGLAAVEGSTARLIRGGITALIVIAVVIVVIVLVAVPAVIVVILIATLIVAA